MKRTITILGIAAAFYGLSGFTSMAPSAGHTGAPSDGGKTCISCHLGSSRGTPGMITSDIPVEGYTAGQTYNVTFTISETGVTKFGFQMTANDASNNKAGSFSATSNTTAQNSGDHITHTRSSTGGRDSKSWTVTWTAPAAGTGDVTFYGSGNAANGDGGTSGDIIKTSTLLVSEKAGTTSVNNLSDDNNIKVFPNPAQSQITIDGVEKGSYSIYDLNGVQVAAGQISDLQTEISIENLDRGVYFLRIPELGYSQRLLKY